MSDDVGATGSVKDWRAIVTLVVFVLTSKSDEYLDGP
jgi:hypothetical protein